ncbi:hypothetical protein A1353_12110 [Methylomonas methanica]|uniref:Uncharacterized protein n=1 Tax=Methylomonas methanica TaxID=421 RepID=A0A177MHJ8_METMH|nr:hypothetical protein A1353_12110 [Methylomonas methanica]
MFSGADAISCAAPEGEFVWNRFGRRPILNGAGLADSVGHYSLRPTPRQNAGKFIESADMRLFL